MKLIHWLLVLSLNWRRRFGANAQRLVLYSQMQNGDHLQVWWMIKLQHC
jgi:hypothetical protein